MTLDKQIIMQILGSLMKQPSILSEVDNYSLIPDDFESNFEKYIFMSIANLSRDGANSISVVDVDGYISEKPNVKATFEKLNGIEYLQDAIEIAEPQNFKYYYTQLKKYNALKDLKKLGYDTNKIYPEGEMLSNEDFKLREKFDNLGVADIFNIVKGDIAAAEQKYGCSSAITKNASSGIKNLLEMLKQSPDVGAPCEGEILNTIVRGARLGKFYLFSAASGVGKTRMMIGNACYIAYPIRYDSEKNLWVNTGSCEKVLYIGTEQVVEEIQTMILAYLTDLNESIIINGIYTEEQEHRINIAIKIMEEYKDNFIITQLPEPNLSQVKTHLRHYCLNKDCKYVFYDYIFATPSLLNEFRDLAIRQDVALRLLSTLLKDLAVELDVFIMSATQITGTLEYKKGYIRNYMMLRDSKSIPDKADFAAIKARVLPEELDMIESLCGRYGYPNQVTDVYKMRRGRWVDVRIWSKADMGTCRTRDLFITDANLVLLQDFEIENYMIDYDSDRVFELLDLYNDGVVSTNIEKEIIEKEAEEEKVEEEEEEEETENVMEATASATASWDELLW